MNKILTSRRAWAPRRLQSAEGVQGKCSTLNSSCSLLELCRIHVTILTIPSTHFWMDARECREGAGERWRDTAVSEPLAHEQPALGPRPRTGRGGQRGGAKHHACPYSTNQHIRISTFLVSGRPRKMTRHVKISKNAAKWQCICKFWFCYSQGRTPQMFQKVSCSYNQERRLSLKDFLVNLSSSNMIENVFL